MILSRSELAEERLGGQRTSLCGACCFAFFASFFAFSSNGACTQALYSFRIIHPRLLWQLGLLLPTGNNRLLLVSPRLSLYLFVRRCQSELLSSAVLRSLDFLLYSDFKSGPHDMGEPHIVQARMMILIALGLLVMYVALYLIILLYFLGIL